MLTVKLRLHNVNFDGAPVREDDPAHATQLARNRRSTHPKRRHPRRAPMADRAAPPATHLAARARTPRRRRKLYSALRRHRVARAPKREVGSPCARGDVRDRGVLWRAVRRVPKLRTGSVRRDHPAWGGGAVVRPVFYHRQGTSSVNGRRQTD